MLPEDDSMDELKRPTRHGGRGMYSYFGKTEASQTSKKDREAEHKEQMLQTLDVEQSEAPKIPQNEDRGTQDQWNRRINPKYPPKNYNNRLVSRPKQPRIPEEPIEPPAFDTGTTLRWFWSYPKPYY